jgi:Asp-tRNA(Asn)/Glu-tRNA(Gln) amidotransferase A subunit family amidase
VRGRVVQIGSSVRSRRLCQVKEGGAHEIASAVAAGVLSARDVVEAHISRIQVVYARLGAIVVPLFESARIEAAAIDERRRGGAPLETLAGVPFTAKESLSVAGTPTTVGPIARATAPAPMRTVVAGLRAAGASRQTNVSQLLTFNETDNPPYGRTNNPCRHVHL